MDRMSDSGSDDLGSNPGGVTNIPKYTYHWCVTSLVQLFPYYPLPLSCFRGFKDVFLKFQLRLKFVMILNYHFNTHLRFIMFFL
jgi:hypothetical protein